MTDDVRETEILAPGGVGAWFCDDAGRFIRKGCWCYVHGWTHWPPVR